MPHGTRIAEFLLDVGAVRLSIQEPYTWTSGIRSPIYCDNRMMYGHPVARSFIADALTARIRSLHIPPDAIAGTATAAIGWAALVADRMDLPFAYVRSKPKSHGTAKMVEGDLSADMHVVVVEDLLSTGGSALQTAESLRSESKSVVTDVVSIFSYDLTIAQEHAAQARLHFHPLTSLQTLLQVAKDQHRIDEADAKEVIRFAKDPAAWYSA